MEEKLLVLAKASPVVSKKYESLVCIGGITNNGKWRRIYPVPWECFWKTSPTAFKKKSWIQYELIDNNPSDHRVESRKINFKSIKPLEEEKYKKIRELIQQNLTTLEDLQSKSHREVSLGIIKPEIIDFIEEEADTEKLRNKKAQKTLDMKDAVPIDIAEKKYSYKFKCGHPNCKGHKLLCEDWELGELYRSCKDYLKRGKYKDENELFQKIKNKMFDEMKKKEEIFFVVGTHYRFDTYIIIGILYPKKSDKF